MTAPTAAEMRAWGREQGYELANAGNVPLEVENAYHAEHGTARGRRPVTDDDLAYLFQVEPPPDWEAGGALCREIGPEMWNVETAEETLTLKLICLECPMREVCRDYALNPKNGITWGVWGGMSQTDRNLGRTEMTEFSRGGESDVPGVWWSRRRQKWNVRVDVMGHKVFGGGFADRETAEGRAKDLRAQLRAEHAAELAAAEAEGNVSPDYVEVNGPHHLAAS